MLQLLSPETAAAEAHTPRAVLRHRRSQLREEARLWHRRPSAATHTHTQISASSAVRFLCNLCSSEQVLNNNIVVILYLGTEQYVTFFLLLCLICRMQSDWRGRSCRSKRGSFPKAICRKASQCRRSQCLHLLSNLCWWWKSKTFSKGKPLLA